MNNFVVAESDAILAIEKILVDAGWGDGWNLSESDVIKSTKPLFYRNSTSVVAADAKVKVKNRTESLYLIYNIIDMSGDYADDKVFCCNIVIALTFYYNDRFLFFKTSPFAHFLIDIINALEGENWVVSIESESAVQSAGDKEPYTNRKIIFCEKIF